MKEAFSVVLTSIVAFWGGPAQAATHALLAAGGCEDENGLNPFRSEYRKVRRHYEDLENEGAIGDVTALFGAEGDSPGAAAISTKEIDAFFERLLQPGGMAADDQVLLHFNTHGSPSHGDPGQHQLCVNDNGGTSFYPISRIREWWEKIRAVHPNARLGLIDQSCYGESSVMAFRDLPEVCVVSANQEGLTAAFGQDFTVDFPTTLGKGMSLQSAFNTSFERAFLPPGQRRMPFWDQSDLPSISSIDYGTHDVLKAIANPLLLAGISQQNLGADECGIFKETIFGLPVEVKKKCVTDGLAGVLGWVLFDPALLKSQSASLHGPTVDAFLDELAAFQGKYSDKEVLRLWVEGMDLEMSRDDLLSAGEASCSRKAWREERKIRRLLPPTLIGDLRRLQRAAVALSTLLADAFAGRRTELGDGFYRSRQAREACEGFILN